MQFSYSRLSSYRQCPRKYNWHYVQQIPIDSPRRVDTLRGLLLHEFAENKGLELPDVSFNTFLDKFELEYNSRFTRDQKKLMKTGVSRILSFFENYVFKMMNYGYQLFSEQEFLTNFYNHELITKMDILLLKRGSAIIVDYKTGRGLEIGYYQEQMALYRYAISMAYTIPPEDIRTEICFLLAETPNDYLNEFLIEVPFNWKEYMDCQNGILETLHEIETNPETRPCLTNMCRYCEYKKVCDISIIAGVK